MRETAGLPAGILVYLTSMILLLLLWQHFFVAPQEWSRLITFMTSAISFQIACSSAEKFTTLTGVKILAMFIVMFWMIVWGADALENLSEVVGTLEGENNKTPADVFIGFVATVWDSRICAGVTFFLTLWTVSK